MDKERERGTKDFGTLGRSMSKAHLSMSQYLDRYTHPNVILCASVWPSCYLFVYLSVCMYVYV